jgi:hypothetical protein
MKPTRQAVATPRREPQAASGRSLETLERKLRFAEVLLGISQKVAGVDTLDEVLETLKQSHPSVENVAILRENSLEVVKGEH